MSASYPSSAAGDAQLHVAVNNLNTDLNGAIDAVTTTIIVDSTTGFPTEGFITIDTEALHYTGTTPTSFTGVTRGADGTTAASHVDEAPVLHTVIAAHHNDSKNEIEAVEADLVAAFGSITPAGPNATDTSMLNRIKSLAAQLQAIAGTANWFSSIAVNLTGKLSLIGGTMTGILNMGSNKITSLANGTSASDAAAFGQIPVITPPTVQRFLSGSGTYTRPTSPTPLYLKIKMVGGGGGGSGSSNGSGGSNGGNGTNTTFSNATANFGGGGVLSISAGDNGGPGGAASGGAGITTILAISGSSGSSNMNSGSIAFFSGGRAGDSFYTGSGRPIGGGAGGSASTNSGSGGAGGAMNATAVYQGSGGGAGGYFEGIITSPSVTYSYSVGTGGSAGSAGTGGFAGGSGAAGQIVVEEYYQ